MPANDWLNALGKPVHPSQYEAAHELLVSEGCDPVKAAFTLDVVCREIRHDNPDRCFRYMRGLLGSNETLVLRTLATLAAPTPESHRTELLATRERLTKEHAID